MLVPDKIGRFKVQGVLGTGAFGAVYRAHDPQLDREIALKVPRPGTLENDRAVKRFLREARAAAGLNHPHIVPVFEAGRVGNLDYIAAAFIPGQTLAHAVSEGPLAPPRAAVVVRDLADALAYAHEQGIVHRDVKPANVLLDEKGQAQLTDFGLAHLRDASERLTGDGAILGTPAYLSPEQAVGRKDDPLPASDQYSLGVVFFHLLTGRLPFEGSVPEVIASHLEKEPPTLRSMKWNVPRDLETICLKALAKRPEDRYPSCRHLADDLRCWLAGEAISARKPSIVERVWRWVRREPKLAAAVGAIAASLLAVTLGASLTARTLAGSAEREAAARMRADRAKESQSRARAAAEAAVRDENQAYESVQANRARLEEVQTRISATRSAEKTARDRERANYELLQTRLNEARKARADELAARNEQDERSRQLAAIQPNFTVLSAHASQIMALAFSADGQQLASAAQDIRFWDMKTGKELPLKVATSGGYVRGVAFSRDGLRVAAVDGVYGTRLWSATTGRQSALLEATGNCRAVLFHPDGRRLITAEEENVLFRDWNTLKFTTLKGERFHDVRAIALDRSGSRVAAVGSKGVVRVWSLAEERELTTLINPSGKDLISVAWSPDGTRIAAGAHDGLVLTWEVATGKDGPVGRVHNYQATGVAYRPDGRQLVSVGGHEARIVVWDAVTMKDIRSFKYPGLTIECMALSPDGKKLATGGHDRVLRLWDLDATPVVQP